MHHEQIFCYSQRTFFQESPLILFSPLSDFHNEHQLPPTELEKPNLATCESPGSNLVAISLVVCISYSHSLES